MIKKSILPVKVLTLIQNLICLAVIVGVVALSFGTIFTATVGDTASDKYANIIHTLDSEADVPEMPKTVDVSLPYIVKSVGSLGTVIKGTASSLKSVANDAKDLNNTANDINQSTSNTESINSVEDIENAMQAKDELQNNVNDMQNSVENINKSTSEIAKSLKNEDFVKLVALFAIIGEAFSQSLLLGIVYVILIILAVFIPVYAAIRALIALISFFIHLAKPQKAFSSISKAYTAVLALFPVLWLLKIIAPAIEFSTGVTTIVALLVVGIAVNLIASRLKSYTPVQFKYVNTLQLVSVAAIAGYFLFMVNLSKTNIFEHIWDILPGYIDNSGIQNAILPILIILVMIGFLFTACKCIATTACRLACMIPTPKTATGSETKFARDSHIFAAIVPLITVAAPVVLMVTDFKLDLGDDMNAFILFAAGAVIMFVSELLMMILKKTVCHGLTPIDAHAVLTGCPTGDEYFASLKAEKPTAIEEAPIEEAPIEEAPAEEAPVEEASIEEAPAEEAPVDEAPVEEAPVEENQDA